ncbi:hypothetical protein DP57_6124 [Burkholderia pseudomallei]|uniref:hypothetical protein n=1 Tax=Burkholderia pseudomallei TaxID=28450 RepID=UPI00050EA708|nr:hypothetical protein [Burkholderia pseudomallei]KGC70054.1 hypothetical protein DP57_6124 [Burkholderia pseudomallei]
MKSLFFKWLMTSVVLLIALIWTFFTQLWSIAADWMATRDPNQPVLSNTDLRAIRTVKFLPIEQQVTNVTVSDLRVLAHAGATATVEMLLTSDQPTTLYPAIRVYLRAGEKTVRTVVYRPAEYAHRERLETEPIRLNITLQPGETGFTASAFFDFGGV